LRLLAERCLHVTASAELSRTQRWIAAMLAGELLANRAYDYAAADRAYEQAQSLAEPGSYEQMSALYAKSRAYLQDGKREPARRACETIVGQFTALRGCEVFERARESLASWDKNKKR